MAASARRGALVRFPENLAPPAENSGPPEQIPSRQRLAVSMARKGMIDMLKRHEIQVLRRSGHSLNEVVELAGYPA